MYVATQRNLLCLVFPLGNSSVELAVTGSGLPVALVPSPSPRFDFLTCVTGRRTDMLCVLQNHCPKLPINFRFRKLAHFGAEPSAGTIPPGQRQVKLGIDLVMCLEIQTKY